jgi:hypothetical protein
VCSLSENKIRWWNWIYFLTLEKRITKRCLQF